MYSFGRVSRWQDPNSISRSTRAGASSSAVRRQADARPVPALAPSPRVRLGGPQHVGARPRRVCASPWQSARRAVCPPRSDQDLRLPPGCGRSPARMTALLWLRRDLRLHDHPALHAALAQDGPLIPVFCFDPRLLGGRHASGPRTQFLLECLADLNESLRVCGSGLAIRRGVPERVLPELARELEASHVFWTADVSPFTTQRDHAVNRNLTALGTEVKVLPGSFVLDDPMALHTASGDPYRVFTPFHRAWLARVRREVLPAPQALPGLPAELDPGTVPTLKDLGLESTVEDPAPGGEHAGRRRMRRFLEAGLADYGGEDLGPDTSSRLSPYLRFGCISARELEAQLPDDPEAQAF